MQVRSVEGIEANPSVDVRGIDLKILQHALVHHVLVGDAEVVTKARSISPPDVLYRILVPELGAGPRVGEYVGLEVPHIAGGSSRYQDIMPVASSTACALSEAGTGGDSLEFYREVLTAERVEEGIRGAIEKDGSESYISKAGTIGITRKNPLGGNYYLRLIDKELDPVQAREYIAGVGIQATSDIY